MKDNNNSNGDDDQNLLDDEEVIQEEEEMEELIGDRMMCEADDDEQDNNNNNNENDEDEDDDEDDDEEQEILDHNDNSGGLLIGNINHNNSLNNPSSSKTTNQIAKKQYYRNKQRCLTLCRRGVTARHRHLLEDIRTLMPHHKKEYKLDCAIDQKHGIGGAIRDIATIKGCNNVLYMECRKRQDAYLWIGRVFGDSGDGGGTSSSSGPSAKFLISNVHTMDELKLTGNCMKGSRPIITFDDSFHKQRHLQLLKELFVDIFGTPKGHPKSKPFIDRIMAFYYADNRIWVRNYQILEDTPTNAKEIREQKKLTGQCSATSLVEIGPRFVLTPIRIFRGLFGGQTLYVNNNYVSPNTIRSIQRKTKGNRYEKRKLSQKYKMDRNKQIMSNMPMDPLEGLFSTTKTTTTATK